MAKKKLYNHQRGPEFQIQQKIVAKLRKLQWVVKETHGNLFQAGLPDLYVAHRLYGQRWIEVKDGNRRGDIFTQAQHEFFHQLASVRIGVWVLTSDDDDEINKLFKEANWHHYLQIMR